MKYALAYIAGVAVVFFGFCAAISFAQFEFVDPFSRDFDMQMTRFLSMFGGVVGPYVLWMRSLFRNKPPHT